MTDGTTPATSNNPAQLPSSTNPIPRSAYSRTACNQPASRRSINSTQSGFNGTAGGIGIFIHDENASHSSRIGTPTQESSMAEHNHPTTTACNQSTSRISINSTESSSNGTARGAGNLIPDENAPYSSRIGTPMQVSSRTEKKPLGL